MLFARLCPLPATEQGLVLTDRPNGDAFVAVTATHAAIARTEAEAPREARADSVEQSRPVDTAGAGADEFSTTLVARGRKKERLAVLLRGEETTLYPVLRCPLIGRVR